MSRPRMRVQSRNSLKNLASIFQSRRGERIRNFIGKYLCHPWVVYSFDSCYKSSDCCRVFTCGFWLVFDVLCVNFRWCCDALWCLLEAVDDLEVVGRDSTRAKFWLKKRPSKDLVRPPLLFFVGICKDFWRISGWFSDFWPPLFPRTTKLKASTFR